jgi:ribonuclease G
MNKLVVTNYNNKILEAFFINNELSSLMLFDKNTILGNIYIAKVSNIVKNIDACFVDIGGGQQCYYSLGENKHIFMNKKSGSIVRTGDELLVQIDKDGVKTKNPVVTSELSLKGEYVIVNLSNRIGVSSKITSKQQKDSLKALAKSCIPENMGCIMRTSCANADTALIEAELKTLSQKLQDIIQTASFRTCYSCVYKSHSDYLEYFTTKQNCIPDEIVSDDEELLEEFKEYINSYNTFQKINNTNTNISTTLYKDKTCSLMAVYNLNKELENAQKERVWLKSGAYLVIQQTEAMVVIDVNTGKSTGSTSIDEHLLKVNKQAAIETCRQIRLRNLSGIIIVDFINMRNPSDMEEIKAVILEELKKDFDAAKFVDITKLGLVEMTRKRTRKSLKEQLVY